MTSRDFCFWLKGVLEFSGNKPMNREQVEFMRQNLEAVTQTELDPFGQLPRQRAPEPTPIPNVALPPRVQEALDKAEEKASDGSPTPTGWASTAGDGNPRASDQSSTAG